MSFAGDIESFGRLSWEPLGDGYMAQSGSFTVGIITPLSADPQTWVYSIDGIDCKWFAKPRGKVKGKNAAKAAVNSVWRRFLARACLIPPMPKF